MANEKDKIISLEDAKNLFSIEYTLNRLLDKIEGIESRLDALEEKIELANDVNKEISKTATLTNERLPSSITQLRNEVDRLHSVLSSLEASSVEEEEKEEKPEAKSAKKKSKATSDTLKVECATVMSRINERNGASCTRPLIRQLLGVDKNKAERISKRLKEIGFIGEDEKVLNRNAEV